MKLSILGASGHGRVVADIAKLNGYDEIEFLDDDESVTRCGRYPVIGSCKEASNIENDIFVAIGNYSYRKKFMEKYADKNFPVLIHPDAVVAEDVFVGRGSVIMAGVVINAGTFIGKGCIVNTCSSVDHDCEIGDFVHVSVGSHICGTVSVKEGTWIGAGSTVSNNINICGLCQIGAGAVVVKDIDEPGTYVGVPVRLVKKYFD